MESNKDSLHKRLLYGTDRRLKTSAEIVEEARMAVSEGNAKLITNTGRPETPNCSGKWARRYAFAKLLPILPEKHRMRTGSSLSIMSVISEPDSPWRKLTPLPERPQSVNESTEKWTIGMGNRRRPLSVMSTTVKCNEAFELMRRDNDAYGFLPTLDTSEGKNGNIGRLHPPRMGLKARESSWDSGISGASTDENVSLTTDDQRSASRASLRLNEPIQMYLKQLNFICINGRGSAEEMEAWAESFDAYLSNENSTLRKRAHLQVIIVQELVRYVEELQPKTAVPVLGIILSLNVTGQTNTKMCKVLYTLCGNVDNLDIFDYDIFLRNFVTTLKRYPKEDPVCVLYLARTLDILCSNDKLKQKLLNLHIFEAISCFMMELKEMTAFRKVQNGIPVSSSVTPVFSAIRSLLCCGDNAKQDILRHGILQNIVFMMDAFMDETELVLYGMRILSNMSTNEECCEQLVSLEPDFFQCGAEWLRLYAKNQTIAVRFLFILGNLLSVVERAQWQLFKTGDMIAMLEGLFEHYSNVRSQWRTVDHGQSNFSAIEDVLVKLARVVANLSVHPGVGSILCQNENMFSHLSTILEGALEYSEGITDELVVNALVALHNLSFYAPENSINPKIQARLGNVLSSLLIWKKTREIQTEACCLLANLTRDNNFAEWAIEHKLHIHLLFFLTCEWYMHLERPAAGALVNLSRCTRCTRSLISDGLLESAFNLLKRSVSIYRWDLASLSIQIMLNTIRTKQSDGIDVTLRLKERPVLEAVAQLLVTHTGDSTVTSPTELDADTELAAQLRQLWEYEFCSASTDLLETLDATII